MFEVQESLGRALEDARTIFAGESPVINFIVGILVAYVVIYFITFYLGPVLFGLRPYHPPWAFYGRALHHVMRRALPDLDKDGELTGKVMSAIDDNNFN